MIVERIKQEGAKQMFGMMGPLFDIALDASIDINLDSFEDLKDNPKLAPAMVSFKDLFESI